MKLILLYTFLLLSCFTNAQVINKEQDIKKINLSERGSYGPGDGFSTQYEIVRENGGWNCYRISTSFQTWPMSDKTKSEVEKETAIKHKLVKPISKAAIDELLKSINSVKPVLDWKIFKITADSLGHPNTSVSIPPGYREKYIDTLKIRTAIYASQNYSPMDTYNECSIYIIVKNNDTIKVQTRQLSKFMLPWKINNKPTYDLSINRFFLGATESLPWSMASNLKGVGLAGEVDNFIYNNFTKDLVVKENFENNASIFKPIKDEFEVENYTLDEYGHAVCILKTKSLPVNVILKATIDAGSREVVKGILTFKDTLARAFESGNFVFNHYKSNENAKLIFHRFENHPPSYYIAMKDLYRKLPLLKNYKIAEIIPFIIYSPGSDSQWLLLPDNKLVLLWHDGESIAGIKPGILNIQKSNDTWHREADDLIFHNDDTKLLLFNSTGFLIGNSE